MKKQKVLFIVHTEYHMLVAISLLCDVFFDQDKFEIWIVQTIEKDSNRFKFPKTLSVFQNLRYDVLRYDERKIEANPEFRLYYEELLKTQISDCIIFNKLSYISFITVQHLSKRGTKVILAPDGAAAYTRITWFTPRWSAQVYFNTLKFSWFQRIRKLYFFWPTLVYGKLNAIDEVWVQFPEKVDNRAGKCVKKIAIMESAKSIAVAKEFFGFSSEDFGNCIFYTNQPFGKAEIYDFEIDTLFKLRQRFPARKIVIKLHPSSDQSQIARMKSLDNALTLTTTTPAELLIADLRNSIVISFWSTSLLIRNEACCFYWLYPMLEKRGLMLKKISLINPTNHIRIVSEIEEIEVPSK